MDSITHAWFGFDCKYLIEFRSQCGFGVDLELDGSDLVIGTKGESPPPPFGLSIIITKNQNWTQILTENQIDFFLN